MNLIKLRKRQSFITLRVISFDIKINIKIQTNIKITTLYLAFNFNLSITNRFLTTTNTSPTNHTNRPPTHSILPILTTIQQHQQQPLNPQKTQKNPSYTSTTVDRSQKGHRLSGERSSTTGKTARTMPCLFSPDLWILRLCVPLVYF